MSSSFNLCVFALLLFAVPAASGAEQDALAIDANIQARHLPYGAIMDPILSLPDLSTVLDYTRCGDSAIWTGHYLAAEAFRYKVTGSADALDNINNAIAAIDNLINVTGGDVLARCALPADSPYAASISSQEAANGIYTGSIYGAPWIWVGNTSRDQYIGVFFGLEVTYDMVTDQSVRNWCSYLATRLLDNLLGNLWNVILPDGSISTTLPDPARRAVVAAAGGQACQRQLRIEVLRRIERDFAYGAGPGRDRLHRPDRLLLQVQSRLPQLLHA